MLVRIVLALSIIGAVVALPPADAMEALHAPPPIATSIAGNSDWNHSDELSVYLNLGFGPVKLKPVTLLLKPAAFREPRERAGGLFANPVLRPMTPRRVARGEDGDCSFPSRQSHLQPLDSKRI
ncbi:MAG TPA: hypothetical protein VKV28_05265 [Candidatus Binataceae bacterium]|nr:hypothetical protein [Candidatus Binataceae bacterium]